MRRATQNAAIRNEAQLEKCSELIPEMTKRAREREREIARGRARGREALEPSAVGLDEVESNT